jgi:hypothetical protein
MSIGDIIVTMWPCPDFVDTELGYFGIPKRFWADMPDR